MARNVEIKARLRDRADVVARVERCAGPPRAVIAQDDTFFASPHCRLKLRRFGDGTGELIAYMRPDAGGPRVSHYEITRTEDPDGLARVLATAYPVVGRVVKQRVLFLLGRTRLHIDRVEGLGDFLELEVVLEDGEEEAAGAEEARLILGRLGVEQDDLLDVAYIDLLSLTRERPAGTGSPSRIRGDGEARGPRIWCCARNVV